MPLDSGSSRLVGLAAAGRGNTTNVRRRLARRPAEARPVTRVEGSDGQGGPGPVVEESFRPGRGRSNGERNPWTDRSEPPDVPPTTARLAASAAAAASPGPARPFAGSC